MKKQLNETGRDKKTDGKEKVHTVVIGKPGGGKTVFLSELMKACSGQLSAQNDEQLCKRK